MSYKEYLQSFDNYFWQWEEQNEIIAIPKGNTIAYKKFITEILSHLAIQGLPPFGSLILLLIATNPRGKEDLEFIKENFEFKGLSTFISLNNCFYFLELLTQVPELYKQGEKRQLLLQALLKDTHNQLSCKKSMYLVQTYKISTGVIHSLEYNRKNLNKDFQVIDLLSRKYNSVEQILESISELPEIHEEIGGDFVSEGKDDLISQLVKNKNTFSSGILVDRIFAGLNIPPFNTRGGDRPLGGISDLTNKGNFNNLLVSEFAHDDLTFLSRIANNEALYMNREAPPVHENHKKTIVLDVSIKNWGTPKTIAHAVMLAIQKKEQKNTIYENFSVGMDYYRLQTDSVEHIISNLQLLEGCLDSAEGLEKLFKEISLDNNSELYFITTKEAISSLKMQKLLFERSQLINYFIFTDREGNIDLYKSTKGGKKHLQHIQLSLKELWNTYKEKRNENFDISYNPLLFPCSSSAKKILFEDEIYCSDNKRLFKLFKKDKGWELIYNNLPEDMIECEIGRNEKGDMLLLIFCKNKKIIYVNLKNNEEIKGEVPEHCFNGKSLYYLKGIFYYLDYKEFIYKVDLKNVSFIKEESESLRDDLKILNRKVSDIRLKKQTVLKRLSQVSLIENGNLVFNRKHQLKLVNKDIIKLEGFRESSKLGSSEFLIHAEVKRDFFEFENGIRVKNYDNLIEIINGENHIYMPTTLDKFIALGNDKGEYCGNSYYFKEDDKVMRVEEFWVRYMRFEITTYEVILDNPGNDIEAIIKMIEGVTGFQKYTAKGLVQNCPMLIKRFSSYKKAKKITEKLEKAGATIELKKQ